MDQRRERVCVCVRAGENWGYQGQATCATTRAPFSPTCSSVCEIDRHGHGNLIFYLMLLMHVLIIPAAWSSTWRLLSENLGCLIVGQTPKGHNVIK